MGLTDAGRFLEILASPLTHLEDHIGAWQLKGSFGSIATRKIRGHPFGSWDTAGLKVASRLTLCHPRCMAFRTLLVAYVARIDRLGHFKRVYLVAGDGSCSWGLGLLAGGLTGCR